MLHSVRAAAVVIASMLAAFAVHAQVYPAKPLRLIVPYPAGGGTDFFARAVGAQLSVQLGQPVVVENRPGAATIIGAEAVAKSAPDGYTLLLGDTATYAVNPSLYKKLPYDPGKDLAPVTMTGRFALLLVVNPGKMPASSVKELVEEAKKAPAKFDYASPGPGSPHHLAMEMFKQQAGVRIMHIPYKGAGPAVTALVAGEVETSITNLIAALPQIRANRMRALAVTSSKRSTALPDAPTIAESGYPKFDARGWFAVFAPAKSPRFIINKLADDFRAVLKLNEVQQGLAAQGAVAIGSSPEDLAAWLRAEIERWRQVLIAANIKPD